MSMCDSLASMFYDSGSLLTSCDLFLIIFKEYNNLNSSILSLKILPDILIDLNLQIFPVEL